MSLLTGTSDTTRGRRPKLAPGKVYLGHQEEALHRTSSQTLEWVAQGLGGVTVPGDVSKRLDVPLVLTRWC